MLQITSQMVLSLGAIRDPILAESILTSKVNKVKIIACTGLYLPYIINIQL